MMCITSRIHESRLFRDQLYEALFKLRSLDSHYLAEVSRLWQNDYHIHIALNNVFLIIMKIFGSLSRN